MRDLAHELWLLACMAEVDQVDAVLKALHDILAADNLSDAIDSITNATVKVAVGLFIRADVRKDFMEAGWVLNGYQGLTTRKAIFDACWRVHQLVPTTPSVFRYRDTLESNRTLLFVRGTDAYAETAILRLQCLLGIEILTRLT